MRRHSPVVAAVLVASLAVVAPVHAQYVEPGPSGGGSCRPATPEIETTVRIAPSPQNWAGWFATVQRALQLRRAEVARVEVARPIAPRLTRPAAPAARRRFAR